MTLISVEARNASLAMSYGALKGSSAPTSLEVALYSGDPTNGGTEITGGGYARPVFDNDATTWPDAPADGAITSAPIDIATSSGVWSDTADFFELRDSVTGDVWDSGPLTDEVSVDGAGVIVRVSVTVFYNELGV